MTEEIINIIKSCCIEISKIIRQGNTENMAMILSSTVNESGDQVKRLDVIANDILKENLLHLPCVRAIGSEEESDILFSKFEKAPYLVCFDPLDGSSNIDVNITVGTIFAIYQYDENNIIKNGWNIECAGYCLYGGSTQFILSDKKQTKMYSLFEDRDFILINPSLKIPLKGNIYSINESNSQRWNDKRYNKLINFFKQNNKTVRWVGSLVADAHRTLLKGGFFSYPGDDKNPNGKLRLLYEVYPFAFIFYISGGASSNGDNFILDMAFPQNIHSKTPVILSSKYELNEFDSLE